MESDMVSTAADDVWIFCSLLYFVVDALSMTYDVSIFEFIFEEDKPPQNLSLKTPKISTFLVKNRKNGNLYKI